VRRILVVGVLAALLVPATASAQEERVLARVDAPTPISAYGSGVLWSARGDDGLFRLTYAEEGRAPETLPGIPPREVPFDADLGPAGDGRFIAVFSRCSSEPRWEDTSSVPDYTRGSGCRLYEYDLTRRRLRALVDHGADEVLPTIWKGAVAYVRRVRGRPQLRVSPRAGGPRRRIPGGPTTDPFDRPTALDLYGNRLATSWLFEGDGLGPGSELLLSDVRRGTSRVVDRTGGGGLTTIQRLAPAFEKGTLFYARACFGDGSGCEQRAGLMRWPYRRGGRIQRAPIGETDLFHARGEGITWVLRDRAGYRTCRAEDAAARRRPDRGAACEIVGLRPRYR
jgi:hypothetical protein